MNVRTRSRPRPRRAGRQRARPRPWRPGSAPRPTRCRVRARRGDDCGACDRARRARTRIYGVSPNPPRCRPEPPEHAPSLAQTQDGYAVLLRAEDESGAGRGGDERRRHRRSQVGCISPVWRGLVATSRQAGGHTRTTTSPRANPTPLSQRGSWLPLLGGGGRSNAPLCGSCPSPWTLIPTRTLHSSKATSACKSWLSHRFSRSLLSPGRLLPEPPSPSRPEGLSAAPGVKA